MAKRKFGKNVVETQAQQRAKFPPKLVKQFVALHNSKYDDKEHEKYVKLAQEYLGSKYDDILERLALIVALTRATFDLVE